MVEEILFLIYFFCCCCRSPSLFWICSRGFAERRRWAGIAARHCPPSCVPSVDESLSGCLCFTSVVCFSVIVLSSPPLVRDLESRVVVIIHVWRYGENDCLVTAQVWLTYTLYNRQVVSKRPIGRFYKAGGLTVDIILFQSQNGKLIYYWRFRK